VFGYAKIFRIYSEYDLKAVLFHFSAERLKEEKAPPCKEGLPPQERKWKEQPRSFRL
jgi:hypothetical protein